ncbi:hypothetical protein QL093DRAFT_2565639 [Fusarium oxysporum]|nr:hypothetical protein QL093DRAFT_2565639 [Fusarium oxysporum]
MAVTRSSRTPSSTSYSKKVKPCHVHNESPTNSPKSISIEPRPPRYPFHHPERRRPEQGKKLPAIPTNSAVDLSQARSHRHRNSDRSQHRKRPCKPICKYRAKRSIRNLKRFNMAWTRSANKTLDIWESWGATDKGSPKKMKRNAALVTATIQTSHYFIKHFEDVRGDNTPKLYKHETIQRLNESVLRWPPRLPIV